MNAAAARLSRLRVDRLAPLAAACIAGYIAVRALLVHGLGVFPVAGREFVAASASPPLHRFAGGGYDGQFVYRLALDPFTHRVSAHGIRLDLPAYRQQRIMTALLAHLLASVPGISTLLALVIVNGLAALVAVLAASRLALDAGRSAAWGLLLAVPAGLPISVARDLTEPVAWAGVLVGLLAARRGRWAAAGIALTVAVLARETTAVVLAGLVVESLLAARHGHPRRVLAPRLWVAVPIVVEVWWQLHLREVWGKLPLTSAPADTSAAASPVVGVVKSFFDGLFTGVVTDRGLGLTYLAERATLLLLMLCAAWLLWRRRARPGAGVVVGWLLACYVAVSIRWVDDVQFLRAAMEAWGLSVLVLLGARGRLADLALGCAGLITAGVGLLYLVRV